MEEVQSKTSQKSARPKSALRRRAAVDLDMTEGEDSPDFDEDIINVETISYHLEADPKPRLSMSSTSHRQFPIEQLASQLETSPRAQSATYSREDEGFINQQGVHELFADILFADPADLDDDSNASGVDEDALYSSSRSFDEEEEIPNSQDSKLRKLLSQTFNQHQDGTQEFLDQEAQMMQRLINRTSFDGEAKHPGVEKPKQFLLGYPELQKASGLRVLRRLLERQKSVEESDNVLVKDLIASYPNSAKSGRWAEKSNKKPPARLKPLLPR